MNYHDQEPITQGRLNGILHWMHLYGPPNCWTGTSGTAATMIRELLIDRERLAKELEAKR